MQPYAALPVCWLHSPISPSRSVPPRLECRSLWNLYNSASKSLAHQPLAPYTTSVKGGVAKYTNCVKLNVLLFRHAGKIGPTGESENPMSYKVNHQKHISEYLQRYTTGTPKEITQALPKAKRTATIYSTISQAILLMVDKGLLRRVGPGTYASALKDVAPIDVMSYRDECCSRILAMLEPRRHHEAVASKEIYDELRSRGFDQPLVMRRLRRLRDLGVISKKGSRWRITNDAFEPTEWRAQFAGTGFTKAQPVPVRRSPRTPSGNGVLGESVPAHNIHRTHHSQRERVALTVPQPGKEFSIFD